MTNFLVTANEIGKTSWKVILTCLFIIVAFFAIFGLIGRVVELIIDRQAKKVDKFMSPLIVSGLIDDDKTFTKTAFKKIRIYFFKTSIAPIFLMIISLLIYIIYHGIDGNWSESIFNDETGIGTLFFTWDFTNAQYYFPLGIGGITLRNTPHFLKDIRILNYFIFLFGFVGLVWYLLNVQGYIARSFRIKKLGDKMFSQNLDNVDLATIFSAEFLNQNNNINKNENIK